MAGMARQDWNILNFLKIPGNCWNCWKRVEWWNGDYSDDNDDDDNNDDENGDGYNDDNEKGNLMTLWQFECLLIPPYAHLPS